MSELTLTVLRLGFLVLLWVFVLSVVGVLRRDLFGTRPAQRRRTPAAEGRRAEPSPAQPAPRRPRQEPAAAPRQPRAERSTPRQLVVTSGSQKGTAVTLAEAPVLVGRAAECTLVLTDDYASSRHARLYRDGGRWLVEDLGSTNGTHVGRDRLTAPTPVEAGTELRVGRTALELRR